jgi:hypothetical protein
MYVIDGISLYAEIMNKRVLLSCTLSFVLFNWIFSGLFCFLLDCSFVCQACDFSVLFSEIQLASGLPLSQETKCGSQTCTPSVFLFM